MLGQPWLSMHISYSGVRTQDCGLRTADSGLWTSNPFPIQKTFSIFQMQRVPEEKGRKEKGRTVDNNFAKSNYESWMCSVCPYFTFSVGFSCSLHIKLASKLSMPCNPWPFRLPPSWILRFVLPIRNQIFFITARLFGIRSKGMSNAGRTNKQVNNAQGVGLGILASRYCVYAMWYVRQPRGESCTFPFCTAASSAAAAAAAAQG